MTDEQIFTLANKTKISWQLPGTEHSKALLKFAREIAAAEREKIIKLADSLGWVNVERIRARGDQ